MRFASTIYYVGVVLLIILYTFYDFYIHTYIQYNWETFYNGECSEELYELVIPTA